MEEVTSLTCSVCNKKLKTKQTLARHRKIHSSVKPFKCDLCNYSTAILTNLKFHLKTHSKEDKDRYPCKFCSNSFRTKQHLDYHFRTHTREKPYKCSECPYTATSGSAVASHVKRKHNLHNSKEALNEENPLNKKGPSKHQPQVNEYACQLCPFKTNTTAVLQSHVVSGHLQVEHVLDVTATVKIHGNKDKEDKGSFPFQCEICSKRFRLRHNLEAHFGIHTGEKPYACTECPFRARASGTLYSHKQKHAGIIRKKKNYQTIRKENNANKHSCPICPYKTRKLYLLKFHIQTHTGDKPHSCTLCPFKTNKLAALNRHIQTHTGEKPYACPLCPYTTGHSQAAVKRHVERNHERQPYSRNKKLNGETRQS